MNGVIFLDFDGVMGDGPIPGPADGRRKSVTGRLRGEVRSCMRGAAEGDHR